MYSDAPMPRCPNAPMHQCPNPPMDVGGDEVCESVGSKAETPSTWRAETQCCDGQVRTGEEQ